MSDKLWATPRNYSFNQSHRPGLTTLDCQVRELYPDKERYHGVSTDSKQLMLFAEAFPANRTPLLADVPAPTTSATCGPNLSDSFASLLPDGSWRKTCQGYSQVMLDGSLERFSETWPRAGMTRNGIAYRRPPSAPLTEETESGSWPTPDANCGERFGQHPQRINDYRTFTINDAVRMWPTPTEDGNYNRKGASLKAGDGLATVVGGALNPTWVEWLMGYPSEWTVCAASATPSCRKSRSGSRAASSPPKA